MTLEYTVWQNSDLPVHMLTRDFKGFNGYSTLRVETVLT